MDVGTLQDVQLDTDFSWEIKQLFLYNFHLKYKNQVLKNIPPDGRGPSAGHPIR